MFKQTPYTYMFKIYTTYLWVETYTMHLHVKTYGIALPVNNTPYIYMFK